MKSWNNKDIAKRDPRNLLSVVAVAAMLGLVQAVGAAQAQSLTSPPYGGAAPESGLAQPPALSQPPALTQPPAMTMPEGLNAPPAQQEAAPAAGCQENMQKFSGQRNAQLQSINALVKSGKGKGLNPVAACPKFRTLVSIETRMKAWVIKNKDWCNIPDQIVEQMKEGFAKTPLFAQRACAAAAQMKRNEQMQAQGGGPGGPIAPQPSVKLPSGPL